MARTLWFPVFALAVFGYLLILVDPANGYLSSDSQAPMVVGIVFLVGFGVISLGTWAYFRYDPPGSVETARARRRKSLGRSSTPYGAPLPM